MTREEAEIKVGQWTGLINALETLGLLKFEPKKQPAHRFLDCGGNEYICYDKYLGPVEQA